MFKCMFPFRWAHDLAWPIRNVQTCTDCGRRFESLLRIGPKQKAQSQELPIVAWPFEGTDGI